MKILINGKPLDIILESEKTVGEVMTGIQNWLEGVSGFFISGLEIDGKLQGSHSLDEAFKLPLEGISSINVKTSSWAELMLEALTELKAAVESGETHCGDWEKSFSAAFLKNNDQELYNSVLKTLNENKNLTINLVAERIREIENPSREAAALLPFSEEIAKRLEDMPLDMQTGKDIRAAETITLFSCFIEKIFRLIMLFKYFGTDIESIENSSIIEEFSTALKELIAAYENKDTVLAGDLAEYELAPRLRNLVLVLCSIKSGEKTE